MALGGKKFPPSMEERTDSEDELLVQDKLLDPTDDVEMDNDQDMDDDKKATPNTPQNAAVVLFHRSPDSPLFKVGNKRRAQEDEGQMDERRKNQTRMHVRAI